MHVRDALKRRQWPKDGRTRNGNESLIRNLLARG